MFFFILNNIVQDNNAENLNVRQGLLESLLTDEVNKY
jgi:hypothetical protein